jgi:hypothetical protein
MDIADQPKSPFCVCYLKKEGQALKRIISYITIGTLVLGLPKAQTQIPSGLNWHLAKEKDGIQVYTAPVENSGRKYIRVNAGLTGSLQGVKDVFQDIGRQKAWVYGTRKSYLVKKVDDGHLLYYNETNLPWPASNRDVVIRMKLADGADHHSLVVTQTAEPNAIPVKKGIVRVSHLSGYWQFHEESTGKLRAEYFLDVDPAGSLPNWMVNLFITKGPYETFVKLREEVKGQQKVASR